MSSDDVRWTGQPSMIDSDNKTKMIRETFVEANVSELREREAGRGDSNSVKLVCDSSSSNGSASSSLSSKVSKRYDPLISIRRTRSPSIRNRDDNDEEEVNSPKHREQQKFMFVSFYEFLVIVLRFNLNSVATMASIAPPRSSKQSIRSKTVVDVDVTPVTQCYRNVAAMLKFSTFFIVLLQVNIVFSYFVIPASAVMVDDSTSGVANSLSDDSGAGEYYDDSVASGGGHYTPTWAVHIPDGEVNGRADQVARDHGFVNFGKIFDDHYHFHHHSVSKRSLNASHHHQERLNDDDRIYWSQQQRILSRRKRDFIRMRPSRMSSVSRIQLNDPKWPQMWYLNRGSGLDMNVIPAWEQGITGKGVVVTILDDGLESDHPDLEHNYDPKASYDVNSHDDDPMPHYDMTDSNRHGTRCAGEVAATANNSLCSVGIAYGAKVGGVRMLDGDVTDAVEARSLALNPQHIDIYSASWGPDDDGKTVDGPGELATRAFIEGVTKGRAGKGSIFIWASGNGGRELDNCNCDGYTNSIWTLSISSATEEGHVPWYSEKCSSTLATTYSSGGPNEKQVVTTDLHHSCTTSHTGTSASAPLAAGIVALVLEANRNLTWRDLQHIVVRTSKPGNLKDPTWVKNGVGRRVSHSFGYGLLDASAMVNLARTWQTVPEQQRCEINAPHVEQMIPAKRYITLQLTVKHCMGVNFLEHVQAKISLTSQRRGDIVIYLQSPAGTRVTLLTSRVHDVSRSGFNEWPFMSVHTWGEAPHGNWLLEIHNEGRFLAQITQWDLIFYGTDMPPENEDPIQIRPGNFGSFGGDLDNNFLQPDSQTAEQWRDMQQNSESHVDIQRTTNDQTNTACTNLLADQRCIECLQATFLYKDRCWTRCPERSYMVPELPYFENHHSNDGREEQSLPRRNIMLPVPQKKCADCHASCLQCRGPESRNCLQCQPGFHLTIVSSDETYCYPAINGNNLSRATSRQGASAEQDENLLNDLRAYAAIVIPAMLIIVGVAMMVVVVRRMIRVRGSQDYAYTQVAFDATNEERQALTTTRHGIQGGPDEEDEHVSNYEIGESSRDWNPKRIEVELSSDSD